MAVAFSSEEQRIYNAREIHNYVALQDVCGNNALSYSQVARLANQFDGDRESVKDNDGKFQQVMHVCKKVREFL